MDVIDGSNPDPVKLQVWKFLLPFSFRVHYWVESSLRGLNLRDKEYEVDWLNRLFLYCQNQISKDCWSNFPTHICTRNYFWPSNQHFFAIVLDHITLPELWLSPNICFLSSAKLHCSKERKHGLQVLRDQDCSTWVLILAFPL